MASWSSQNKRNEKNGNNQTKQEETHVVYSKGPSLVCFELEGNWAKMAKPMIFSLERAKRKGPSLEVIDAGIF